MTVQRGGGETNPAGGSNERYEGKRAAKRVEVENAKAKDRDGDRDEDRQRVTE